jgi:hypothetical protein
MRLTGDVPLLVDTTEWITSATAHEYLKRNVGNRPVNWKSVEAYAEAMTAGQWTLHGQGIMFDTNGHLISGQNRLWGLIYSGLEGLHMRVSRGNPVEAASVIDRGRPQSARDLATRASGRRHAPIEASIARAFSALMGNLRPTADVIGEVIEVNSDVVANMLGELKGMKKTRAMIMVMGAICAIAPNAECARDLSLQIQVLAANVEAALLPQTSDQCWGKGPAFGLAMKTTEALVRRALSVTQQDA